MLHLYWIEVIRRISLSLSLPPPPPPNRSVLRVCSRVQAPLRPGRTEPQQPASQPTDRPESRPAGLRPPTAPPPIHPAPAFKWRMWDKHHLPVDPHQKNAQENSANKKNKKQRKTFNGSSFVESVPRGSETWRGGTGSYHWVFYQQPFFVSRRSL